MLWNTWSLTSKLSPALSSSNPRSYIKWPLLVARVCAYLMANLGVLDIWCLPFNRHGYGLIERTLPLQTNSMDLDILPRSFRAPCSRGDQDPGRISPTSPRFLTRHALRLLAYFDSYSWLSAVLFIRCTRLFLL
ncbi:hypothetical protein BDW74DRAFT_146576 [Aspergillus multicolor]|uniref:uncharacterized protein n=1 Tax=Aspergillus multicolor TaxID=41759 RepID=UPI003CCE1992